MPQPGRVSLTISLSISMAHYLTSNDFFHQEFRKEIENQAPLRDRVLKAGQKLLLNQNYDTRGLSERLDNYESEWRQLEEGATKAGEFLHERQMELMPSRQAMTELTSWINQINKSLAEDAKRRVKTVADIEVMVKKYKVNYP